MRNTLKQIFKHTGTIYGQDISNKLHNRRVVVIAKPHHTADMLRKHEAKVSLRENNFQRIQDERIAKETVLITAAQTNTDLTIPLAELHNDKVEADQMRNTLKQIFKHTSTIYGQDISNDILNSRVVVIAKPQHTVDGLRNTLQRYH